MPEVQCPKCDGIINRSTDLRGNQPVPVLGQLAVCLRCGAAVVWTLALRLLTKAELDLLPAPALRDLEYARNQAASLKRLN